MPLWQSPPGAATRRPRRIVGHRLVDGVVALAQPLSACSACSTRVGPPSRGPGPVRVRSARDFGLRASRMLALMDTCVRSPPASPPRGARGRHLPRIREPPSVEPGRSPTARQPPGLPSSGSSTSAANSSSPRCSSASARRSLDRGDRDRVDDVGHGQPRSRSLTGLCSPCSTGPIATAPAERCTAL